MSLATLIAAHGYWILALGCLLEGDTVLVLAALAAHASLAAVAVRFAYGVRIAGPMLIGASSMPPLRFVVLNALSAVAWAPLVGAVGWLFGEAARAIFGHLAHVEGWLFGALIVALVAWRLLRRHSAKA